MLSVAERQEFRETPSSVPFKPSVGVRRVARVLDAGTDWKTTVATKKNVTRRRGKERSAKSYAHPEASALLRSRMVIFLVRKMAPRPLDGRGRKAHRP